MRIIFLLFVLITGGAARAQLACSTQEYNQQWRITTPVLLPGVTADDIVTGGSGSNGASRYMGDGKGVLTIPVVFHILYNNAGQNVDESLIRQQLVTLNTAFRKKNADTTNIPEAFKGLAADCEIEFKLAIADPQRRATNGIVRKYTSIKNWLDDDKMKSAASGGSDGWDAKQYLNIWVCNLALSSGYSSFPGDAIAKDGIVLKTGAVGLSKVLIHEAGHWLGLKHLWGDTYCGDDLVDDTPKQSTFTPGCPTGIRPSCGGGAPGDMYMNYMDFTSDACLLMFTHGQKARMWSNFVTNGKRAGIIDSKGLTPVANDEIPLPGEENPQKPEEPVAAALKLYPNPAINRLTVDVGADDRWLGKTISIYNTNGEQVLRSIINGKQQAIDITRLLPGLYFVAGKQENGEQIRIKFIKN